jgi:metal-responsive CopG/Arc/MetJ family transcriptional regulator
MKRSTITLPNVLADALDAYIGDQEVAPSTTAIIQVALEAFLSERGYLPSPTGKQLRLTPVKGGDTDTSVKHDEILYGQPELNT